MADQNNQNTDDNNNNTNNGTDDNNTSSKNDDPVAQLVEEKVAERVKEFKSKVDTAFAQRDEANRKIAELEAKIREEELKKLESEGKVAEALQQRLDEERAKREVAERRNMELSRDSTLRTALMTLEFRNERAAEMAYRDIVEQLVQNDKGMWVHKSGVSISDFVGLFAKDENQAFLFKVKANKGSGGSSGSSTPNEKPKSLFAMSQDEVLKLASEGKLPNQRK